MVFNSLTFVAFFALVLVVHNLPLSWRVRKFNLLIASYLFYSAWNPPFVILLWISTIVDWYAAQGLVKARRERARHAWMLLSVVANLGMLGYFKYGQFLLGNFAALLHAAGIAYQPAPHDIVLPVGISFYTFQSMSYTIDVFRGDSPPRRNFLDYSLFIAFFPQLVAGPIVRDGEFFRELDRDRQIDFATVRQALVLIALGYVKKVSIADNLAAIVEPVFDATAPQGFWDTLLAIYAFAMQIYCDFSGYTDIAIGCALLLGFRFPKNFNYPYVAESIQDFWRRWHMTLSRWLRDYLYISLGGNRKGPSRTRVNLMLTMLLGGLWHGASWNFVIWGGLHGLYLACERIVHERWPGWNRNTRGGRLLRVFITFHLVCFAWIFFRAHDLAGVGRILGSLGQFNVADFNADRHLTLCVVLGGLLWAQFLGNDGEIKRRISESQGPLFIGTLTAAMLAMIWFTPNASVPFIYFQF